MHANREAPIKVRGMARVMVHKCAHLTDLSEAAGDATQSGLVKHRLHKGQQLPTHERTALVKAQIDGSCTHQVNLTICSGDW